MKKRAVISTIASIALAGAMCAGLAACGETAESIKGEEVTAEQWAAALGEESLKNFKVDFDVSNVAEYEKFSYEGTQKMSVKFVNGNQYITMEVNGKVKGDIPDDMKEYFKEMEIKLDYYYDGENAKFIDEADGKWTYVTASSTAPYAECYEILEMLIDSDEYEDYEYSADKKGYVLKGAEADQSPVIKFKDGKLKAVYAVNTGEQDGTKYTMTISAIFAFGGQEVTLPTVA